MYSRLELAQNRSSALLLMFRSVIKAHRPPCAVLYSCVECNDSRVAVYAKPTEILYSSERDDETKISYVHAEQVAPK